VSKLPGIRAFCTAVEVPPREQTWLNYGHTAGIENPEKQREEVEATKEAEESVFRVTLRSSTKHRPEEISSKRNRRGRHKNSRKTEVTEPDSSGDTPILEVGKTRPQAENGSGVERHRIPEDISEEIRRELTESEPPPVRTTVTFDDVPVIIPAPLKVDEYDIIADIKAQKTNVTFGELLHDNVNYQKVIRDAWNRKRI
jgi:hypothetical protein